MAVELLTYWKVFSLVMSYVYSRYKRLICGLSERHEENITGRIVIITGANAGLGKMTAIEMAKRGATVVLACRNPKLGNEALEEIKRKTGSNNLILMNLDLGDLESVRNFASEIDKKFPSIDILINNAGIFDTRPKVVYNKDGNEVHFAINHLGHFLLTNLLLPSLKRGAPSRVVTVGSTADVIQELDIGDLNFKLRDGCSSYGPLLGTIFGKQYSSSKFANALFSFHLGKLAERAGVHAYSICPGLVETDVFRHQPPMRRFLTTLMLFLVGLNPRKGVETILYCSISKLCAHETGLYYRFSSPYEFGNERNEQYSTLAKQLWEESEYLAGLKKRSKK